MTRPGTTASTTTRVLLVDDQQLIRVGFAAILETEPGIEVVGQATDGAEGVRLAAELDPDVICMDVQMPVMDGIEATRRITASGASAAVLILTTFDRDDFLFQTLQVGASGFLLKTAEAEELIAAVTALGRGDGLLSPQVTRRVLARFAADRAGADPAGVDPAGVDPASAGTGPEGEAPAAPSGTGTGRAENHAAAAGLTDRERQTLRLMARGHTNAEIAAELFVGEATVKTHVSNVLMKLGARDRVHAVIWAFEHGLAAG